MTALIGKTAAQFARALKNIISQANREFNQEGPPNPKVIQKLKKNYSETKGNFKKINQQELRSLSGSKKPKNKRTESEIKALEEERKELEANEYAFPITRTQDKKPVMDRAGKSSRLIGAGEGSHTKGTTPFRDDVLEDSKKASEGTDTGKGEYSDKARELRIRGDKSVRFKFNVRKELKRIQAQANAEINKEGPTDPKVIQKLRRKYGELKTKYFTKDDRTIEAFEGKVKKAGQESLRTSKRKVKIPRGTKNYIPRHKEVKDLLEKTRKKSVRIGKKKPKVPEGEATFKKPEPSKNKKVRSLLKEGRKQSVRIAKRKAGDNKFVSPAEINRLVTQANDLKTTIANTDVSQRINRVYKIKLDKITNKVKEIKKSEPYYFPKSSKPPKKRNPTDKDFAHVEKTSRQLAKLRKEFAAIEKDFKEALDSKAKLVKKQAGMKNTVYGPRTTNKKNLAPGTYTDDKGRKKVRDRRRLRKGEEVIEQKKGRVLKTAKNTDGPTKLNAARLRKSSSSEGKDLNFLALIQNKNKIEEILSDPDFAQQERKINQLQKLAGRFTKGQRSEMMRGGTGSPPQVGRKKSVSDEKTTNRSFADKDEYEDAPDPRGTPEQVALKRKRPKRNRSQIIKNAQNAPVAIQNLLVRQGIIKRSELKSSYVPKKTKTKPYKPKKPEVRKGKPRVVNGKTVETTQYRKKGGKVLKAKPKRKVTIIKAVKPKRKVTTVKRKTTAPRKRAALRGYGKALRGF